MKIVDCLVFAVAISAMVFLCGCASVKYERATYKDGKLVSIERGHYSRLGDQKISRAEVLGASLEGQEATSELGKHIAEGIVEGIKVTQ